MKQSSILAAIVGNVIEWYDFTLYVFLSPVIAHNFFPKKILSMRCCRFKRFITH